LCYMRDAVAAAVAGAAAVAAAVTAAAAVAKAFHVHGQTCMCGGPDNPTLWLRLFAAQGQLLLLLLSGTRPLAERFACFHASCHSMSMWQWFFSPHMSLRTIFVLRCWPTAVTATTTASAADAGAEYQSFPSDARHVRYRPFHWDWTDAAIHAGF